MNNLFLITKCSIINNLRLNKLNKRFNKKGKLGLGALTLAIYLVIIVFITGYFYLMNQGFSMIDKNLILVLGIVASSLVVLFSNLGQTNSLIFKAKDFDFLSSLPVKNSTIVISKLLTIYFLEFAFSTIIIIPVIINYSLFNGFDVLFVLYYLLIMVFIPFIPIFISGLLSLLFSFIPIKDKTRNIISSILMVVLMFGFLFVYFTSMNFSDEASAFNFYLKLGDWYFISKWIISGFSNVLYLLLFLGVSVLSILLFVLIASIALKYFHTERRNTNSSYDITKQKYEKSHGITITLFKKELRQYILTPMYLANTIMGPLMAIISVVLLSVNYNTIASSDVFKELDASGLFSLVIPVAALVFLTTAPTTASQISLEGKGFWHLKVLPISFKQIVISKMMINLMITIPGAIISFVVAVIFIKPTLLASVIMLVVMISVVLFATIMGLLFNLYLPKLDFESPAKVVKQGIPVMFSLLLSFGILIILGISVVTMYLTASYITGTIVQASSSILLLIVSLLLLKATGYQSFKKITY